MIKLSYLAWAACGSNLINLAICLESNYLLTSCFFLARVLGSCHSDSTTNCFFGEPWRLRNKITMFCFMASNRRYYLFLKFGLAVFLFGLFLRDITFNESGAVIAVHAKAVTIDRSVVCEKFVALHPTP